MSQTSVTVDPAVGRKGQLADPSLSVKDSFLAEGHLTFGLLVQNGTAEDQVVPVAALPANDVNSIVSTAVATAASAQTIEGAQLDGVIGAGRIIPAQLITVALSSHADFDVGVAQVIGEGPDGSRQVEILAIPDAGNVTLTTSMVFSRLDKIEFPAGADVNGGITVGTNIAQMVLSPVDYPGFALYDPMLEPYAAATEIEDERDVSILSFGRVLVVVESTTAAGDPCFVRMLEASADLRGQVRGTPAANFFRLEGARFKKGAATDGLAILEMGR